MLCAFVGLLVSVPPAWASLHRLPAEAFTGDLIVDVRPGASVDVDLVTGRGRLMSARRVHMSSYRRGELRVSLRGATRAELWEAAGLLLDNPGVARVIPRLRAREASSYVSAQLYRDPSPYGVDAEFAAGRAHAQGAGVRVGSVEGGWNLSHEDLPSCLDVGTFQAAGRDHGTAVLGEIFAKGNAFGITGIAPQAICEVSSWVIADGFQDSAIAVDRLAVTMHAGDIIFVSGQVPGPNAPMASTGDQRGFVPIDYDPVTCEAIEDATAKGIVVIIAAGNGGEDLDRPEFDGYRARSLQANAIVVGAGSAGDFFTDGRARLPFSTFGSRVDVQGLGEHVTSTGYGDVDPFEADEDRRYTYVFAGTSSATPIVAGVAAALQSYAKSLGRGPLTADEMRSLLIATGAEQTGNILEHIGPYPDLKRGLAALDAEAPTPPPPAPSGLVAPAPTGMVTDVEPLPAPSGSTTKKSPQPKVTTPQAAPAPQLASNGCQQGDAPWLLALALLAAQRARRIRQRRAMCVDDGEHR